MKEIKLNLIAAACQNMGIGINGNLPWRLKNEMEYFTSMTTETIDKNKKNAVVMGRRTWDCIPTKYKPLTNRINYIITHNVEKFAGKVPDGVVVQASLDNVIEHISNRNDIESIWIIGGSSIYKEAMNHPNCSKIYLTEIQKDYECDTFFPTIDKSQFTLLNQHCNVDSKVPTDIQTENDIQYYYRIYCKN